MTNDEAARLRDILAEYYDCFMCVGYTFEDNRRVAMSHVPKAKDRDACLQFMGDWKNAWTQPVEISED